MSDFAYQLLITIISIIVILIINYRVESPKKVFFANLIFTAEGFTLSFLFGKFYITVALLILFTGMYFLLTNSGMFEIIRDTNNISLFGYNRKYFDFISATLLFSMILFEGFLGDGKLNTNGILFILFCSVLLIYNRTPEDYTKMLDYVIIFIGISCLFWIMVGLTYKAYTGQFGIATGGWIADNKVVEFLLVIPVVNFLNLLGYNVYAGVDDIYFENLESGLLSKVGIAESCSGIYSIMVFIIALVTFFIVENKYRNVDFFLLGFLGILMAYLANLLRISIIILTGHYYGYDALIFVHSNLGWIIFSSWLFIFWLLLDKFFAVPLNNN